MTNVRVVSLAVGDGACSVVAPWPLDTPGSVGIIDCGVRRAKSSDAADMLLQELDHDLSQVDAVVVSHFDWDHWGGLKHLASRKRGDPDLGSVPLYYPTMPLRLQVTVMAFLGPMRGSGVAALDLKAALAPLQAPGHAVKLTPCHIGGPDIVVGGELFEVIWPPQVLPPAMGKSLAEAVEEAATLAADLAKAGYPQLQERIDDVYAATSGLAAVTEQIPRPASSALDHLEAHLDEDFEEDHKIFAGDGVDSDDSFQMRGLPPEWRDTYRRVLNKVRAANNNLSLVLASRSSALVAFGDLGGPPLRHVGALLKHRSFRVMLAPHHGTYALPNDMPSAKWCVAQNGKDHVAGWRAHHVNPSTHATRCHSTHDSGTFTH